MTFFEFDINRPHVYNLTRKWLRDQAKEYITSGNVVEKLDTKSRDIYQKFISNYVTSENDLIKNEYYSVSSIYAELISHRMSIEYTDAPMQYLGITSDNFIFKSKKIECHLPCHNSSEHDNTPYFFSNTIYSTVDECSQFITLMLLQFSGKWKIYQKKVPT